MLIVQRRELDPPKRKRIVDGMQHDLVDRAYDTTLIVLQRLRTEAWFHVSE
jgi:hypothetical protein